MSDPYFSSVVLLAVNDNQPNGTTTFADQSSFARALTRRNNSSYSNAQAPSGMTTSMLCNGPTTADGFSAASSSDFAFGTADYTIEAYCYFSANSGIQVFCDMRQSGNNPLIYSDGTNQDYFVGAPQIQTPKQAAGAWFHWAVSRVSGTTKMFIGGSQVGSSYADSNNFGTTTFFAGLPYTLTNTQSWNGYLCSIRVTKGVGRYSGAFTPPTLPLPLGVTTPVADFSGTPLSGNAPLLVSFSDLSANSPTSWSWSFGDGNTSAVQNPTNTYQSAGTYDVSLTATNSAGSNTKTKTGYVTVSSGTPAPGNISGANTGLDDFPKDEWYDGRRPGEPWQVPQWAVEERERLLAEREEAERRKKYAELSQKLVEAGNIPPPIESVFIGNKPLLDISSVRNLRIPEVPEINDDEDAIVILLLSE